MSWTEERVALLKKLWTEGYTASQIAGQFGDVTRNAVIGKVHRLGLSGRATTSRFRGPRVKVRPKSKSACTDHAHYPTDGNLALKAMPATEERPMAKVEQRPVPKPLKIVETAPGERVDLLSLKENMCRWPIGDPGSEGFGFCGCKTAEGSPYCEHHARIAYQPVQRRRATREAA